MREDHYGYTFICDSQMADHIGKVTVTLGPEGLRILTDFNAPAFSHGSCSI